MEPFYTAYNAGQGHFGDFALVYLKYWYPPVPVIPGTKQPGPKYSQYWGEPLTEDQVLTWVEQYRTYEIGVLTGPRPGSSRVDGLFVLDVDPATGGTESLKKLIDQGLDLSGVPEVKTQSGGSHFYFRQDEAGLVSKRVLPGIDIKADRGMVLVPPSYGPSGGSYSFVHHIVALAELPVVPELLKALVRRSTDDDAQVGDRPLSGNVIGAERRDRLALVPAEEFEYLWSLVHVDLLPGQRTYRCPWHDDRRGSLSINAEQQLWRCHGCERQGVPKPLGR